MDKTWTIQKRILAFRVFDDAHTADNIYKNMKLIFEEYKIESKLFSIGFDNTSNNTAAIPALIELCKPYFNSKFFHQRCVCHVLNLCVQKGLEILQAFIKPIKEALSYLWKHPNVMKAWVRFCKQAGQCMGRLPMHLGLMSLSVQCYAWAHALALCWICVGRYPCNGLGRFFRVPIRGYNRG
ncbi:hypothetical protein Ddye_001719 [Dipteronia dyeriana]|uniref:DUF659 domain-containing protein n=1 Tax=Dipteronia dyeriana TaxID=168575 RepID=A0AAE0CTN3_9ROSI|nr:hypothetical protein Ddye_001719 [Dipteronia dyeriana]